MGTLASDIFMRSGAAWHPKISRASQLRKAEAETVKQIPYGAY